jgi:hypothetical protein
MTALGHLRRFSRKSRTSAYARTPDISLRRTAANIAKLPEVLLKRPQD